MSRAFNFILLKGLAHPKGIFFAHLVVVVMIIMRQHFFVHYYLRSFAKTVNNSARTHARVHACTMCRGLGVFFLGPHLEVCLGKVFLAMGLAFDKGVFSFRLCVN